MKIAWICFAFNDYSIVHANSLADEHSVLLVLPAREIRAGEHPLDPAVELLPFQMPRLRQPIQQLKTVFKILRKVREFDPDVIHYQHGHLWFNLALPLLRRFPLVLTIHDPRHHMGDAESKRTPQRVMDFGFRRADRVIVHGREIAEEVHRELSIPKGRIEIIPHVAIGDVGGHKYVEEDEKSVLFFGRIWGYKGLEYLIRAEPLISEKIASIEITIAGKGEDMERYRLLMKNPGRFVIRDAWIDNDERAQLFQRAAVVVLPYVSATQSGVVPVAYSFGKPVVATTVGALPEYVDHGRTGLLVPPRDEKKLAAAVVQLLQDVDLRHTMGENGKRMLFEKCAPDVVARRTVEVYRRAVKGRLTGGRSSVEVDRERRD
jgi:glycosyltransferase involved in cell wall biosynthesis